MKDISEELLERSIELGKIYQTPNSELGITQEYNAENRQKLWDNKKRKDSVRDKAFDGKNTYKDPISGKILHKNYMAAQKKYHAKDSSGQRISSKYAGHVAEVDHINPLKKVQEHGKYNPMLTNDNLNEIANADSNLRILSKSMNASKGDKSDLEFVREQRDTLSPDAKKHIIKEKITSDVNLQKDFALHSAKNAGVEFVEGAGEALVVSAIPLAIKGIEEMIKTVEGEQDGRQTAENIGKASLQVAKEGGKNKLKLDIVNAIAKNSKSSVLNTIQKSAFFGQIVEVSTMIGKSMIRFVDGDVDAAGMIQEIGVQGTSLVAGMVCGEIGAVIGQILCPIPGVGLGVGQLVGQTVGMLITSVTCDVFMNLYNTSRHLDDYKKKEQQIRRIENEAISEMRKQRDVFKTMVENEYKEWDDKIYNGFNQIITCACEETFDLEGVTDGLNSILQLFGKEVAFKSMEQYEDQLGSTLVLKI